MKRLALVLLAVLALLVTVHGPVQAYEAELAAYARATADICSERVTPAAVEAYRRLAEALDRAQVGRGMSGSETNFWGPTDPETLLSRCVEAGGDGGNQ
jgi:hypothetical protein